MIHTKPQQHLVWVYKTEFQPNHFTSMGTVTCGQTDGPIKRGMS